MNKFKFLKWMTETEEERLARQAKQEEERKLKAEKKEQDRLHKLKGDKVMIQNKSFSTTDSKGHHHVTRTWKVVQLTSHEEAKQ